VLLGRTVHAPRPKSASKDDTNDTSVHGDVLVSEFQISNEKDSEDDGSFYWRERLNRAMESLTVNIMVMVLIMVDVGNVLYYLIASYEGSEEEPWEQMLLTITVLGCFVLELLLRIIAQRRRFFWNVWNVFGLSLSLSLARARALSCPLPRFASAGTQAHACARFSSHVSVWQRRSRRYLWVRHHRCQQVRPDGA
jgi:hypothetical protein